jgi:hypothetical protein
MEGCRDSQAYRCRAVRIKVELIDEHEVWNDGELEEDCFELIRADVARLRQGETLSPEAAAPI